MDKLTKQGVLNLDGNSCHVRRDNRNKHELCIDAENHPYVIQCHLCQFHPRGVRVY